MKNLPSGKTFRRKFFISHHSGRFTETEQKMVNIKYDIAATVYA